MENTKIDFNNLDKKNWDIFKFKDISKKISEVVKPKDSESNIYIGLEHLDGDDIHIRRFGKPSDVSGGKLKCYPGDIIFGKRRAYQRKAAIVNSKAICSAHSFVFRANENVINKKLFPFFLHSNSFMHRMIDISVGGLSPTINWSDLKDQEFLLPPKKLQERFSDLFWKIDNSINSDLEFKKKLHVLLFSLVKELYSSKKLKIKISECIIDNKPSKVPEGHTPYIEIGDIDLFNKVIKYKEKKSVKGAILAKKDSVIVSNVRPNRGAVSLLNKDQVVSSGFSILIPNKNKITKEYLFHLLSWNKNFTHLMSRLATGTTYPTITYDDVINYQIPFIKKIDQENFSKKLNEIYYAILDYENYINKKKNLIKSLINKIL